MADIKFSQFISGGSLEVNDEIVGLRSGINTKFDVSNIVNNTATQAKYVAQNGSDISGTGTILRPFATIAHALSVITTNSATTPFEIICSEGVYNESALALKPYININGNNAILNVTGNITADASFNFGGFAIFSNFFGVTVGGSFNLNISGAGLNPTYVKFSNINFATTSTIIIVGSIATISDLENIVSNSGVINVSLTNTFGQMLNCNIGNFGFLSNGGVGNFIFNLQNNIINGTLGILQPSTGGITLNLVSNKLYGAFSITGSNAIANVDVDSCIIASIPSVFSGGIVNFVNIADTLNANYIPVNYSVSGISVKQHLQGIDNALGGLATPTNSLFVASTGSDITGNGSIDRPFATIAHAMSTITGNTVSNTFTIFCLGGVINETSQILLKPYVGISGLNQGIEVFLSGNMILDASYLSSPSATTVISNIGFTGSFNFDFSSSSSLAGHVFYINDCRFGNISLNSGSSAAATLTLYSVSCTTVTSNNSAVIMIASTIANLISGNLTSIKPQTLFIIGNSISGNVDLQSQISAQLNYSIFRGNWIFGTVTLTNPLSAWDVDVSSYKTPIIVNNAVVILNSISNGLLANYTPVNYTPVATAPTLTTSIQAHLHGIDNALGGVTIANNYIWVSNTGSDITGNGSIDRPFASVSHALSTITTATSINTYTIVLIGGTITDPAQIFLKPFISISGLGEGIELQSAPFIGLDASWGTTSNGTMSLTNFSYESGDIILDFSSFSNSTTHTINILALNSSGRSLAFYGNANTQVVGYVSDCIVFSLSVDNAKVYAFNNIMSNGVLAGQFHSFVHDSIIYFFGNYIVGNANLKGGNGSGFLSKFYFAGNQIDGSITGTGTDTTLYLDVVSYKIPSLSGAAVVLQSIANGISANYPSPTKYTPVDTSVNGHLQGINSALGNMSLQQVYSQGANAQAIVLSGRPAEFKNASGSLNISSQQNDFIVYGLPPAADAFTTPPGTTATNANTRMEGYTFTPTVNLFATQFQYLTTAIVTGTRQIGLWQFGNTSPLATGIVSAASQLDENAVWRYEKINPPILLTAGIKYVLAGLIPAGETWYLGTATGINSNITINSQADAPDTSILTYPSLFPGSTSQVIGNASLGLSLTTQTNNFDINSYGITNIYGARSVVYPAIITQTGFTSGQLNYSFFQRVGNIVDVSCNYTLVASAANGTITLAVPYMTGTFIDNAQSTGVGVIYRTISPSLTNFGIVQTIFSSPGTPFVQINTITSTPLGQTFLMYLNFKYKIQ